ncbi:MAG: CBS domain-containing protein [Clostridiales bacterium]|nr:CBS domain-containing protein [Clostridiales bacterium]
MYVSELNLAKPVSVPCDISAAKAYQQIEDIDHTKFPVTDKDGKLVGIVDKAVLTDISSSSSPFKELKFSSFLSGTKVRDVMNGNVYSVKESSTVWEAALTMKDHRVSILPVVDEENRLTGVLSRNDLFNVLLNYTGAKYAGLFISVEAKERTDIFTVTNCIEETGAELRYISVYHEKICLKVLGPKAKDAETALREKGFKIIYTVSIN